MRNQPLPTAIRPRYRLLLGALTLLALAQSACSLLPGRAEPTEATPVETPSVAVLPTTTPTDMPTAVPTDTPEPTPIPAMVRVSEQELGEDGVLTIDEAALPEAGWLVVFNDNDGEPGELLGYVDLPSGVHSNVRVTVDPFQATGSLIAQLRSDLGDPQELELPEPDVAMSDNASVTFSVDTALPQASVATSDQVVGADGVFRIDDAQVLAPTWVVVHADDGGAAGDVLGQVLLTPGDYEDLTLPIRWREATPQLHIVLHEDSGQLGYFDFPEADQPLLAGGAPVMTTIAATYPPDLLVFDQPVVDATVVIERTISNGPGWVVVHQDDNGQPGLIIGNAPLNDGLNEQVEVELLESALTPILFARLHEDTTTGDEFSYPEFDPPVMYEGRLPQPQRFRTDSGGFVVIRDQLATGDGDVVAAVVMTPAPAWLVIHEDADGVPGAVLGRTWVPVGISRDVAVAFDAAPDPGAYHAVLYQDLGELETFDFPDGPDAPVRVQGGTVAVPFELLGSSE